MNSAEISTYKNNLILKLLQNAEIVALLDQSNEFEYPDDLIYERVFPYGKIPGTAQEVESYITISVDVPSISAKNDVVRNVTIIIRVISHCSLMRVPQKSGTRVDLLASEVDKEINESYDFGIGYVTLTSNREYTLNNSYFYRELIFRTLDLNSRRYGS